MHNGCAALLVLVVVLSACTRQPAEDVVVPENAADQISAGPEGSSVAQSGDPRASISPTVFEPYDKSGFPKLARKLGASWARIQPVREAAAFKALESGRCDFVELAEVSDNRSTKENIAVFVDCRNLERFYVSESDVKAAKRAVTQSSKSIGRAAAIAACAEAARRAATYPSLVDAHTWAGASFSSDRTTGGARVLLDFEATNALGVELPYRANCLFPADAAPELSITAR